MYFLTQNIKFTGTLSKQILIGALIGMFLTFILFFLQPFDSNNFESDYKSFYFIGYGVLLFLCYVLFSRIETIIFKKLKNRWTIKNEILSLSVFFLLAGTLIYLYNDLIVNNLILIFKNYEWFMLHIVSVLTVIFLPLLIFLRNNFGVIVTPEEVLRIHLKGSNKNERLSLNKEQLLYIKASENYVEIVYDESGTIRQKIFRNTLNSVHQQVPFLLKCHRSYLVNPVKVESIKGNSQKAVLSLKNIDIKIPVSKTFYKKTKAVISH